MDSGLQISPLEKSFKMKFTDMDELLDFLEITMPEFYQMESRDVKERISKGLYSRESHAKKNDLIVSLKHKQEHQFVIQKGSCAVFTDGHGWKVMEAGHHGLTTVGTRRLIYVFEDLVFTSFHPIPEDMGINEVRAYLIDERQNKFIKEGVSK